MIKVHIHDEADSELARVYMRQAPAVGELLWTQGDAGNRLREAAGSSSFTVVDVAHWVGEEWSPGTHTGDPIHSVCAYVKPTQKVADDVEQTVTLSKAEADLARQWFNAVEDVNPSYLGQADSALGLKLHDAVGVYASDRLRKAAKGEA